MHPENVPAWVVTEIGRLHLELKKARQRIEELERTLTATGQPELTEEAQGWAGRDT